MNLCAVRSLEESYVERHNNLWSNAVKLPHEPESEHRIVARAVTRQDDGSWKTTGSLIVQAVCKHCGDLYLEEK